MHLLIFFAFLALLSWAFPSGIRYLFVAPILGLCVGGFAWAIAAMLVPALITLATFAWFVIAGIVGAELVALVTK